MGASAKKSGNGTIKLDGVRTIRTAEQSHTVLLEAIRSVSAITLDCSQASEVDVSFVQLVLSARKTAADFGKGLKLSRPANAQLRSVLARGGFLRADSPADELRFWLKNEAFDENHS
jgi:hypothetical protein